MWRHDKSKHFHISWVSQNLSIDKFDLVRYRQSDVLRSEDFEMVGRVDSVFGTSFKKKSDLSSFFPYLRDDFHYQNKFLGNSKKNDRGPN